MSIEEKERRERIIKKARELFGQHGYSKVTMEEIANSLGISKKTLYHFFANKQEVLREMMEDQQCEFMDHIESIWKSNDLDFIGKVRTILDYVGARSSEINHLQEIQKVEPEIWDEMHDYKRGKAFERVRNILEAGFETGIFRYDVDRNVLLLLYMHAVEAIINPETLSDLPLTGSQAFEAISRIIFEGILTDEGRKKYLSYSQEPSKAAK